MQIPSENVHLGLLYNRLDNVCHQISIVVHENLPVLPLHHLCGILLDEADHLLLHLAIVGCKLVNVHQSLDSIPGSQFPDRILIA